MTNKKNKLITFFVSLIPGAGEMYLGFYKSGASIMLLFFGTIALAGTLLPPVFYLLPVLWFYSFFHTHNLNTMSDEEFYGLEDDYLFHLHPGSLHNMSGGQRKLGALLLILMGISIIWNQLWNAFRIFFEWLEISSTLFSVLHYWVRSIPRLAAAILIIWIGVRLIRDKKDSLGLFSDPYEETYDTYGTYGTWKTTQRAGSTADESEPYRKEHGEKTEHVQQDRNGEDIVVEADTSDNPQTETAGESSQATDPSGNDSSSKNASLSSLESA